jgi:hypothetical protein
MGQLYVRERNWVGTQMNLGGKDDILTAVPQSFSEQSVDAAA